MKMFPSTEFEYRNRNIKGHNCSLPLEDEIIKLYIDRGILVQFRRKFRKFLMVNTEHPDTKYLFKSTLQIRQEERRHLKYFYYMIHPFSQGRFMWECWMIFEYLAQLLLIPWYFINTSDGTMILRFLLEFSMYIDIILFFFTGYHDTKYQKIVLGRRSVIKHYLKTFFIFDFISCIPLDVILQNFMYNNDKTYVEHFWYAKFLLALRLLRIRTLKTYVRRFFEKLNIWSYKLKLINFTVFLFIVIWWVTAFLKNIMRYTTASTNKFQHLPLHLIILECYNQAVRKFLLVGFGSTPTKYEGEMIFQICSILTAILLNIIILAKIMQFYNRLASAKNKHQNLVQQLGEYVKYKDLPPELRERVFQFVNFKYYKQIFKESDILSSLSSTLREVLINNY